MESNPQMDWKDRLRSHVRGIVAQTKEKKQMITKEDDELISAVKALIVDIESMSCTPDLYSDSGYWFGEFSEYQENADGDMVIEWPNLAILVERLKKVLDKEASR